MSYTTFNILKSVTKHSVSLKSKDSELLKKALMGTGIFMCRKKTRKISRKHRILKCAIKKVPKTDCVVKQLREYQREKFLLEHFSNLREIANELALERRLCGNEFKSNSLRFHAHNL